MCCTLRHRRSFRHAGSCLNHLYSVLCCTICTHISTSSNMHSASSPLNAVHSQLETPGHQSYPSTCAKLNQCNQKLTSIKYNHVIANSWIINEQISNQWKMKTDNRKWEWGFPMCVDMTATITQGPTQGSWDRCTIILVFVREKSRTFFWVRISRETVSILTNVEAEGTLKC